MARVVVCTFREKPKSYHLDAGEAEVPVGTRVVAETDRGWEIGRVKWPAREQDGEFRLLRVATSQDIAKAEENAALERQATHLLRERANHYKLPMKPVGAECLLDRSKMFVFYECESRVDFRDLVRDMASQLGVRIHLQGVNSREAARIVDGVGVCGQPLCCSTWLSQLPPVTLRMAKEQHLGGAPSKISGACGRLMCCLRYEIDFYRDQNQRLPRPGDPVDTSNGPGHVLEINALSERCLVRLGDGRYVWFEGEELRRARIERGPVRACKNHISQGGACGGSKDGKSGCSSGGCSSGKCGGCGVKSAILAAKKRADASTVASA